MNTDAKVINKALFVLFAEFLGYVSPLIDWAEEICEGKKVDEYKVKIIELDADFIFAKMQEAYSLEEIKKWYEDFYPLVLQDYENKLNNKK